MAGGGLADAQPGGDIGNQAHGGEFGDADGKAAEREREQQQAWVGDGV